MSRIGHFSAGGGVNVSSGIGPFDERTGGFRPGGLYLVGVRYPDAVNLPRAVCLPVYG